MFSPGMSEYIHKSHNVSVLLYHFVCPAKYRKFIFCEEVDKILRDICIEISIRYEIIFLEIGVDNDHVHFFIQSVPRFSPQRIIQTIKSITAKQIFKRYPDVRRELWGGEFWSDGYYVSTVGKNANEDVIRNYVKKQGRAIEYQQLYKNEQQLNLF